MLVFFTRHVKSKNRIKTYTFSPPHLRTNAAAVTLFTNSCDCTDKYKYICLKVFLHSNMGKNGKVCCKAKFQSKTLEQAVS